MELVEDFHQLGFNVGFLTSEFRDRGLIDEEGSWLGIEKKVLKKTGKMLFEPSDLLASKPPIQDCSPEELVKLYVYYLQGKSNFFARQFEYGTSFKRDGQ